MFPMIPLYPMIPNLFKLGISHDEPPTIYSLLNSYVNYSREVPVKIKDLARTGRVIFFDFDYPLAEGIDKADFETMILNHFLMRRIGYETVTAFKIALDVKLNEKSKKPYLSRKKLDTTHILWYNALGLKEKVCLAVLICQKIF